MMQNKTIISVMGIKGGVGTTTISAALASLIDDSFHYEFSLNPSGYMYYGKTLEDAVNTQKYDFYSDEKSIETDKKNIVIDVPHKNLLTLAYSKNILNVAIVEKLAYMQPDCFIVVADNSFLSFRKVSEWLEKYKRIDVLLINKVIPDVGLSSEVYKGQLGLENVMDIPGTPDEEKAINLAQKNNESPVKKNDSFYLACMETVKKIGQIQ
ncbi:hypothetical protein PQ692_10105 [Thermoanaerobacterium thermosaccharolyticum]|uniref:hypothetical protein n=1 Tax=Thermoanaerobacterium thermosaccharolyticum TaxID=1517 RepID=UPI003D26B634